MQGLQGESRALHQRERENDRVSEGGQNIHDRGGGVFLQLLRMGMGFTAGVCSQAL